MISMMQEWNYYHYLFIEIIFFNIINLIFEIKRLPH